MKNIDDIDLDNLLSFSSAFFGTKSHSPKELQEKRTTIFACEKLCYNLHLRSALVSDVEAISIAYELYNLYEKIDRLKKEYNKHLSTSFKGKQAKQIKRDDELVRFVNLEKFVSRLEKTKEDLQVLNTPRLDELLKEEKRQLEDMRAKLDKINQYNREPERLD